MTRRTTAGPAVTDPLRLQFMGRIAHVLRDLGATCSDLQDNLGSTLASGTAVSSAASAQLQELDRVTQTVEVLAALFADLESRPNQSGAGIAQAIELIRLQSVRERLLGLERAELEEIELF
jgi:hypothetical protein